jgi:pimeloyl-ACP methyl ester carboxylesterase
MTYFQARDDEQLARLQNAIGLFISRYNANPATTNRKTIILFPGGMGSQLFRANAPYSSGASYFYDLLWVDCGVISGKALQLRMQDDLDDNQQIVIPDGPVQFFPILLPYEGFKWWCNYNDIDYFIFGWDWRRDLRRTVRFFKDVFMPIFESRVQASCSPDPLQNLSLVGHSFGGMVVKLIMNDYKNPYVQLVQKAVTVATPFYGYGGQLPRYFIGEPDLNVFYGSNKPMTEVVSSLQAPYSLLFLDQGTYLRDGALLAADPLFPLIQYPILDANTGVPVDPYDNPITGGGQARYPQNYGVKSLKLIRGKLLYEQVAAPLMPAINNKFFNIRGVQVTGAGAVINDTVNNQTWNWIAPNFDPDSDPCPITDYRGPGDGVLPAWSTRLVSTPPANVVTLQGNIDHTFMMSDALVLNQLAMVI